MSQYAKYGRTATHSAINCPDREMRRAGTYQAWQAETKGKAVSATATTGDLPMYRRDRLGAAASIDPRVLSRDMAFDPGDGVDKGTVRRWDNGAHKARKHRQGDFVADGRAR